MSAQITVFRTADESASEDAAKVQQMLADEGIAATLLDDTAPGVPSGVYEVQVDAEDLPRAEQLVAQFSPDSEMADVDPSHALDLVTVYTSAAGMTNELEALAVQAVLEAGGISAVIVGDSPIPSLGQEVRVAKEHEDQARQLIAEAQAAGPAAAEEEERATENSAAQSPQIPPPGIPR
jgi:hypothetical protein